MWGGRWGLSSLCDDATKRWFGYRVEKWKPLQLYRAMERFSYDHRVVGDGTFVAAIAQRSLRQRRQNFATSGNRSRILIDQEANVGAATYIVHADLDVLTTNSISQRLLGHRHATQRTAAAEMLNIMSRILPRVPESTCERLCYYVHACLVSSSVLFLQQDHFGHCSQVIAMWSFRL